MANPQPVHAAILAPTAACVEGFDICAGPMTPSTTGLKCGNNRHGQLPVPRIVVSLCINECDGDEPDNASCKRKGNSPLIATGSIDHIAR